MEHLDDGSGLRVRVEEALALDGALDGGYAPGLEAVALMDEKAVAGLDTRRLDGVGPGLPYSAVLLDVHEVPGGQREVLAGALERHASRVSVRKDASAVGWAWNFGKEKFQEYRKRIFFIFILQYNVTILVSMQYILSIILNVSFLFYTM